MKPILFESTATVFDSNGTGILADAVSCIVTEERNGVYELAMEYPVTGIHFREIAGESIIKAKPNLTDDPQPFRVYRITKPFNGIVTVYASHISYDLSGIPIQPFSAASAPAAMAGMKAYSAVPNPFTFWTDKTTAAAFAVSVPSSARSLLGGQQGSLLDVYDGEYAYDGYTVRLYAARGENRGVSIRYGKNLTSLEQDENCANVYTGVYPYWTDGNALVQLPEKIVYAAGEYNFTRILTLDCSAHFDTMPTEGQLRSRAERYIEDNAIGVPKVSLTVSFVQLEQTEEYKHLALLERVSLCDTVNVEFPAMGVSAAAKCVKTEYDALMGRYKSVGLGDARTNIADTIVEQQKQIDRMPSTSFLMQAVENLTGALLGAKGGAVRLLDTDGDGEPDTLYIADDPDPKKAVKVWRFNYEGWGASTKGYNGPYTMGASLEHGIVADFITTGTLLANLIRAGVLQSLDGKTFYLDLEAGVLRMQAAELSISGKTVEDIAGDEADAAYSAAIGYADTAAADAQSAAESYADSAAGGALTSANGYTDEAKGEVRDYADGAAESALVSANNYTDAAKEEAQDYADLAAESAVNAQTQEDIFNRLTNNGALQGLYMENGQLYINASYLKSGEINAELVKAGILSSADGNVKIDLDAGTITITDGSGTVTFSVSESGDITANNATLNGGTFSGTLQAASGTFAGELQAATGTFSGNLSAAGGTFSGALQAADGTFTGTLSGADGTFTGRLTASSTYFNTLIASSGSTYVEMGGDHIQCGPVIIDGSGMEMEGEQNTVRFWMNPPTASGGTEARWVNRGSNYSLGIFTSRREDKKDIADISDEVSAIIDSLRPVYFRFRQDTEEQPLSVGFIAEETAEVCEAITSYAADKTPVGVQYSNITALLVAELQRLRRRVAALEAAQS